MWRRAAHRRSGWSHYIIGIRANSACVIRAGIGTDTFFARLQSITMGGVGTSGIIGGSEVGGVMGLTFVQDICKKVDDLGTENWVVSSSLALIDMSCGNGIGQRSQKT